MKKVLVAGSLNVDLIVGVSRFPNPGETLQGNYFQEDIGGKGANQASASARQNVPTSMWGCVGNDAYGHSILKALEFLSISSHVSVKDGSTGLAFIELSEDAQNRIVIIPGANALFNKEHAETSLELLSQHDILVLQNEIPLEVTEFLAYNAKSLGLTVVFNPAPAVLISDNILGCIDYLIPNEHELGLIASMPTGSLEEVQKAMEALVRRGAGCLITTMGSQGVFCLKDEFIKVAAPRVKAVDTTGAGDAFVGAFAAGLAKGLGLKACLQTAVVSASFSVTRKGAFGSAGTEQEIAQYFLQNKDYMPI